MVHCTIRHCLHFACKLPSRFFHSVTIQYGADNTLDSPKSLANTGTTKWPPPKGVKLYLTFPHKNIATCRLHNDLGHLASDSCLNTPNFLNHSTSRPSLHDCTCPTAARGNRPAPRPGTSATRRQLVPPLSPAILNSLLSSSFCKYIELPGWPRLMFDSDPNFDAERGISHIAVC